MKKAQLTMMIILGILILAGAITFIYITSKTAVKKTEDEPARQRIRQAVLQPVKDYITSCLDVTTTEAINLLAKQGGFLYKPQGGTLTEPLDEGRDHLIYEDLKVSFAIFPPEGNVGTSYFANPPKYPFPKFPYIVKEGETKEQFFGYYGISNFPPLIRPGKNSVQENIEVYIANNIERCTQWQRFEEQGLEIKTGKPNASVMIAENITQIRYEKAIVVMLNWTINITELKTNASTSINEFAVNYPMQLAKLYRFAEGIIASDVTNISFDIKSRENYPVIVIEDIHIDEYGGDDIIIVQDKNSEIAGKPLELRFARKNRAPALFWINQEELDGYKFIPAETCDIGADNVVLAGDLLKINLGDPSDWDTELKALDPDEDEVEFYTKPPAPIRIDVLPGTTYKPNVCVRDLCAKEGSERRDCQLISIKTTSCPVGE